MSRKLNLRKKRKGFTLIELILVIAIIGILGAIIVPKFTGVAEDATLKADLASARTIESAVILAMAKVDDVASINEGDINEYLSNVEVKVYEGDKNEGDKNDWIVKFIDKDNFTIYKGEEQILPEQIPPKGE